MEGNGIYVRADNSNEAMRYMQKELDKIAKDDVETKVYSEYNEQFPVLAWIAIALLLLEYFLMEKKNGLFRNFKLFD
jgi:Ca-activated chloride channel family protein